MAKIKYMTAHTSLRTGNTSYRVYYKGGSVRQYGHNDSWPLTVVKFFTSPKTVKTADKILGAAENLYATRYERFEQFEQI